MATADLHLSAALLAQHHARLSIGLLAAITAGPRQGVALAKAAGVRLNSFPPEEDVRVLWLAMEEATAQGLDKTGTAKLCVKALRDLPCWRPDGPITLWGETWNVESINLLFNAYPTPAVVPALAAGMIELSQQRRRIHRLAHALDRAVAQAMNRLHPRDIATRAA